MRWCRCSWKVAKSMCICSDCHRRLAPSSLFLARTSRASFWPCSDEQAVRDVRADVAGRTGQKDRHSHTSGASGTCAACARVSCRSLAACRALHWQLRPVPRQAAAREPWASTARPWCCRSPGTTSAAGPARADRSSSGASRGCAARSGRRARPPRAPPARRTRRSDGCPRRTACRCRSPCRRPSACGRCGRSREASFFSCFLMTAGPAVRHVLGQLADLLARPCACSRR